MKRMPWLFSIFVVIAGLLSASCGDGDGVDETLTIRYWQAPSIANPYLTGGTKDIDAATLVLEPLANYDEDAQLVPRLAEAIPTMANGGISEDLRTITWQLKAGIVWSDGSPFTAYDADFTYDYACSLPNANCQEDNIEDVRAIDELTLEITFESPSHIPTPNLSDKAATFCRRRSLRIAWAVPPGKGMPGKEFIPRWHGSIPNCRI